MRGERDDAAAVVRAVVGSAELVGDRESPDRGRQTLLGRSRPSPGDDVAVALDDEEAPREVDLDRHLDPAEDDFAAAARPSIQPISPFGSRS